MALALRRCSSNSVFTLRKPSGRHVFKRETERERQRNDEDFLRLKTMMQVGNEHHVINSKPIFNNITADKDGHEVDNVGRELPSPPSPPSPTLPHPCTCGAVSRMRGCGREGGRRGRGDCPIMRQSLEL